MSGPTRERKLALIDNPVCGKIDKALAAETRIKSLTENPYRIGSKFFCIFKYRIDPRFIKARTTTQTSRDLWIVRLNRKVTQRVATRVDSPNSRLILSGGSGKSPARALVGRCINRASRRIKANPKVDAKSMEVG
jgi:hypothetical protein